jgi:hypothetical protein
VMGRTSCLVHRHWFANLRSPPRGRNDIIFNLKVKICDLQFALLLSLLFFVSVAVADERDLEPQKAPQDSIDWQQRLEQLRSVPYVGLSDEETEQEDTGVKLYDPQKAYDGYNLYCVRSAGAAYLIDMKGREVHRWTYRPKPVNGSRHAVMNDHVIMLENGDAVILKKKEGLIRVGWDSTPRWEVKMRAHHDVAQASDGSFYVLINELHEHRGLEVWFDVIVHLDADGQEIGRWSTYDHLEEIKRALDRSVFLDAVLDSALVGMSPNDKRKEHLKADIARQFRYDYFHTNTVTVLPATPLGRRDQRFRQGNLLVCFRNIDQIAILEQGSYRILWSWGVGELEGPHHSTMLENGNVLVFNNGVKRVSSSIVELDPVKKGVVWEYQADPPRSFYTFSRGSAQRLPNGNTLICVSDKAYAFEVTPEGEVVWKWQNPVMVGKHCETFYRMMRLEVEPIDELVQSHKEQLNSNRPVE